MTLLCELAEKYGSDKCPARKHHYTEAYYGMFANRREQVRKVVEIGVGDGASLYMWREFFPNAVIFGADYWPGLLIDDERIHGILCDQSIETELLYLLDVTGPDVDLFVDDGSHNPGDQLRTCLTVLPRLDAGAIYAIEDVGKPVIGERLRGAGFWLREYRRKGSWDDRLFLLRRDE